MCGAAEIVTSSNIYLNIKQCLDINRRNEERTHTGSREASCRVHGTGSARGPSAHTQVILFHCFLMRLTRAFGYREILYLKEFVINKYIKTRQLQCVQCRDFFSGRPKCTRRGPVVCFFSCTNQTQIFNTSTTKRAFESPDPFLSFSQ